MGHAHICKCGRWIRVTTESCQNSRVWPLFVAVLLKPTTAISMMLLRCLVNMFWTAARTFIKQSINAFLTFIIFIVFKGDSTEQIIANTNYPRYFSETGTFPVNNNQLKVCLANHVLINCFPSFIPWLTATIVGHEVRQQQSGYSPAISVPQPHSSTVTRSISPLPKWARCGPADLLSDDGHYQLPHVAVPDLVRGID